MKIGILGTGHIGKSLVMKLSAAAHDVKVANSRGPETIEPELLANGARAVTAVDVVSDVDVVIMSVPLERIRDIVPLFETVRAETVVIDTSNFMPYRSGKIEAIEGGQVESQWVEEQLGRPIAKAWNSIYSESLATQGKPVGTPGRIALPVAADRENDRKVAMSLVEETGFDAVDAGPLAESWRQQPGSPAYCTDQTRDELLRALASAERDRLPKRRDLVMAVLAERFGEGTAIVDREWVIQLGRAIQI